MTKNLDKAIMKRSRLRNKFMSDRTKMSRKEYKKQRNFCANLLKRAKKEKQSINFIHSHFIKRKQRTKVDSAVSSWEMLF